jgi:UPF0755 protein
MIPERAVQTFGSPTPGLSFSQRLLLSTMLVWQSRDLTHSVDPFGMDITFQVEQGESIPSIINRLWQMGLISNPAAFRSYLQYAGLDITLKAGKFTLNPAMTPIEIAQSLQNAIPSEVTFNVLAGWRTEEIASALPSSGLKIDPNEFLRNVRRHPSSFGLTSAVPQHASGEGFLFTDVYTVSRDINVNDFINLLYGNFEIQVTPEIRNGFNHQGLNLYEAVILASIVEREAVLDDEMPLIASVFLNRLLVDMELASDPTVQYALGYNRTQGTWWTNPLSYDDLKINSPYNTYIYPGLPPGPIANPSLNALKAVAFPANTPYYFFRAACDGSGRHLFAQTFEEHKNNACP